MGGALPDWNELSDEDFRAEVRAWVEANYPPELRFLNHRALWAEIKPWYLKLSKQGWLAPNWPREHGGMGLDPSKLLVMFEEIERHGIARSPDHGIVQVGPILIRFGTDAQREKYLPAILAGEHIWCQGYSEPNSGSDLASLKTSAVIDGDDLLINC